MMCLKWEEGFCYEGERQRRVRLYRGNATKALLLLGIRNVVHVLIELRARATVTTAVELIDMRCPLRVRIPPIACRILFPFERGHGCFCHDLTDVHNYSSREGSISPSCFSCCGTAGRPNGRRFSPRTLRRT